MTAATAQRRRASSPAPASCDARPSGPRARLAELVDDPDAFVARSAPGCRPSPTPSTSTASTSWRPGIGPIHGVRRPLLAAVGRGFRRATRARPSGRLLFVADRLLREPLTSSRTGSRSASSSGRSRRARADLAAPAPRPRREAGDWITVDSLAHPYAPGHPRRALPLGGARAARLLAVALGAPPRRLDDRDDDPRPRGRRPARRSSSRGLPILGQLMGDAEPDVQKALVWAYRSLAEVDLAGHDRGPATPRPSAPRADRRRPPRLGHPRQPAPSSTRPSPPSCGPVSTASAAARRPVHLRAPPPRPPRFGRAARSRRSPPRARRCAA